MFLEYFRFLIGYQFFVGGFTWTTSWANWEKWMKESDLKFTAYLEIIRLQKIQEYIVFNTGFILILIFSITKKNIKVIYFLFFQISAVSFNFTYHFKRSFCLVIKGCVLIC